jgi:hypothetical protein
MKLHILFGQRKEAYEGEHAPEPLLCWSEFEIDDNPEGWEEAKEKEIENGKSWLQATREICLSVDGDRIRQLLVGIPTVAASISGDRG